MNDTKRWIGIDGGGTKTTCVIGNQTGKLLAVCQGASSNIQSNPLEDVKSALLGLVHDVLAKTDTRYEQLEVVYFALAGGDRARDKQRIAEILQPLYERNIRVVMENDAMAALASGTWGDPGIVLIAGTGSIAYACTSEKPVARVGGWGYLLGDEGSGYEIGRNGMIAALKDYDGRGEETILTERITKHFDLTSLADLPSAVYAQPYVRAEIAQISKIVMAAAKKGDQVAVRIIEEALNELVHLVEAARKAPEIEKWPVVISGGLFSDSFFKSQFIEEVHRRWGNLQVIEPSISAAAGAFILALKESKIEISDQMKQTAETSWRRLEE